MGLVFGEKILDLGAPLYQEKGAFLVEGRMQLSVTLGARDGVVCSFARE